MVEATMPVNPYNDCTVSLGWLGHGMGILNSM